MIIQLLSYGQEEDDFLIKHYCGSVNVFKTGNTPFGISERIDRESKFSIIISCGTPSLWFLLQINVHWQILCKIKLPGPYILNGPVRQRCLEGQITLGLNGILEFAKTFQLSEVHTARENCVAISVVTSLPRCGEAQVG